MKKIAPHEQFLMADTVFTYSVENGKIILNRIKSPQRDKKPKASKSFNPPTIDEVKAYCEERNKDVDADKWYDFYQAKGWMVGKNKMVDWKAAVRTWEKKGDSGSAQQNNKFVM